MWHALRHTYATHLRSSGVRWEAVEYMMGHRPRDTTGRYVHLLASDKAAVEAALTGAFGDIVDLMLESNSRIGTASP
jgi:integrase